MTTEIGFYHCTRAPVARVAVQLAEKAYGAGQRLLVVASDELLETLDRELWTADPASFLPHGRAGTPDDAEQPILLAGDPTPANGARLLMLADRALPPEIDGFDRVLTLFEDGSEGQLRARGEWKALAGRPGLSRSYWQQGERGGWARKA